MAPVTRRTFLKSTAAATIAVTANATPAETINVVVIGCRNRGRQLAESFLGCDYLRVAALCDCDTAMRDDAMGKLESRLPNTPMQLSDFRHCLDDPAVDAVAIATPDHWHAMMTIMALDAGKHVYIEKPVSHSIEDGKAMMAAQARHPELIVHVGTQQRSGAHFRDAKAYVDSGGLGKVGFARAWVTHTREAVARVADTAAPATMDYDLWAGPGPMPAYNENRTHYNWRWVRDWGTGEMGNWGAHWLDVARWFLDLDVPTSAAAHGGTFVTKDIKEWPDTQTVLYAFPELSLVWEQRLWTDYSNNRMRSGVEFSGDQGTMLIDRSGWTVYPRDGKPVRQGKSDLMAAHVLNFAEAVRGVAPTNAPLGEGHKSAVLCHLGNISSLLNRQVAYEAGGEVIVGDPEAAALGGRACRAPWSIDGLV